MTDYTTTEIMSYLWSPGKHSLCAKHGDSRFQVVGYFDKYEDLLERASQMPEGSDVWWGVHGMAQPPKSGRGGVDDVTSVVAMSADFDWADEEAHKATPEPLPSEETVRRIVAEMTPAPSIIINSGHGLQVYWVLAEELDGGVGRMLIDGFFRYVEDRYGLSNDRVDLASILRVPGSMNNKAEPVEVVVEHVGEDEWNVNYLFEQHWLPMPEPIKPTPKVVEPPKKINGSASWNDDEKPSDWLNRTATRAEVGGWLSQGGWTFEKMDRTNEHWMRPGINDHHGLSLHENCSATLFTTSAPPDFKTKPGTKILTPFDIYAAVFHGGMFVKAAQDIGRNLMPRSVPAPILGGGVEGTSPDASDGSEEHGSENPSLNLPDEFWNARPMFSKIKQAAWSRGESPDSTLAAVITRYAAAIPPTLLIPPIVGAAATFDHLSVVVGNSSGGKSSTMSIARDLWEGPVKRKDIVWDLPNPNGEGLISTYFELQTVEEGGKKVQKNVKTKTSVHFSVDEAMALVQAGGQRQGTTIASVLCSAWAGQNPGQSNASVERRRVGMDRFTFRMAGMMGIQTSLGHNLLTPEWIEQGLSGRILFLCTDEPRLPKPADQPSWPGKIDLPLHDGTTPEFPTYLTYADEIVDLVKEAHWLKKTGRAVVAPIDGHLNLLRLKISGILALMDGRVNVTIDDWNLTEMVVGSHLAIRASMQSIAKQARYDESVTKATASGHFDAVRQEATDEVYLKRAKQQIMKRLQAGPKDRQALRDGMSTSDVKKQTMAAVTALLDEGLIKKVDSEYELA